MINNPVNPKVSANHIFIVTPPDPLRGWCTALNDLELPGPNAPPHTGPEGYLYDLYIWQYPTYATFLDVNRVSTAAPHTPLHPTPAYPTRWPL